MKPILFLLIISLMLAACAPQATPALPTDTPTSTPIPASSTVPPTPTSEYYFIPTDVQKAFEEAGVAREKINEIGNATYGPDGLTITDKDGDKHLVSNEDLKNRLVLRKDNTLQILDENLIDVEFAYNPVKKEFLFRGDYVIENFRSVDDYPSIDIDGLPEFVQKTELFVKKFPPNVNLIEPRSVTMQQYSHRGRSYFPFGPLGEGEVNGAKNFGFFKVRMDPVGNPDLWTACSLTLVPNFDGTFALIPVTTPGGWDMTVDPDGYVPFMVALENHLASSRVLLPVDILRDFDHPSQVERYRGYLQYLKSNGINYNNFKIPVYNGQTVRMDFFTDLISEWLETGIVPKKLKEVISMSKGVSPLSY